MFCKMRQENLPHPRIILRLPYHIITQVSWPVIRIASSWHTNLVSSFAPAQAGDLRRKSASSSGRKRTPISRTPCASQGVRDMGEGLRPPLGVVSAPSSLAVYTYFRYRTPVRGLYLA
jgi:hypothetical protein